MMIKSEKVAQGLRVMAYLVGFSVSLGVLIGYAIWG